jgi:hypothetical protein
MLRRGARQTLSANHEVTPHPRRSCTESNEVLELPVSETDRLRVRPDLAAPPRLGGLAAGAAITPARYRTFLVLLHLGNVEQPRKGP